MLSINGVSPDTIRSFIERNGGSNKKEVSESWRIFLKSQGLNEARLPELEVEFLRSKGGIGTRLWDLWNSYLDSIGYSGSVQEKINKFFKEYTLSSSSDLLMETGDSLLLETGDKILIE